MPNIKQDIAPLMESLLKSEHSSEIWCSNTQVLSFDETNCYPANSMEVYTKIKVDLLSEGKKKEPTNHKTS